jgi:hypothetical protein
MPLLLSPRFALAAMLIGAGLLAAPAARAFTVQDESGNLSADDQSFLYPDRGSLAAGSGQTQGFKQEDGVTTYKQGNTTFQFGRRRSFEERYNTDHLFDPLGKPPGVR